MMDPAYSELLSGLCERDTRFTPEAYVFVCEALQYTTQSLKKPDDGPSRHVSGHELLEGARTYALQQYGPMSRTVLRECGLNQTEDVGEIVFNMVEAGLFGKTETDTRADFANGYDFDKAFREPFMPDSRSVPPCDAPIPNRAEAPPADSADTDSL